jgi:hypothetical protein
MRPAWEPRPDKHTLPLIRHAFEPWKVPSTGRLICIHLQGGGVCGRVEDEHAPVSELSGDAVQDGGRLGADGRDLP